MMNEQMNNEAVINGMESNQEEVMTKPSISELFVDSNAKAIVGGNQLSATARLTNLATELADKVWATVSSDNSYIDRVQASMNSHDAMDDLIGEVISWSKEDYYFLENETPETLEKMIRSQQSKRSRAKSKAKTHDNYMTMMIGAIAELILRDAAGKPKSAGGGAVMGDIGYSDEDLQRLADYPDELKKAIRNVQSKKSIMRSKVDFDEESPRWKQLLEVEQQLKDIRDNANSKVAEEARRALEEKKKLQEALVAAENVSPEEAKQLLDQIKNMLAAN